MIETRYPDIKVYKGFHAPEEVDNWVHDYYSQAELDPFDMNHHLDDPISDYKGPFSKLMNAALRAGITDKYEGLDIGGLQELLLETHIPENIIVFRFVDLRELWHLWKLTAGGRPIQYDGFLSTTLLPKYYSMEDKKFLRIPIRILAPAEIPGTYLPEVNPELPEYEILFPHGLKLRRRGLRTFIIQGFG